MTTHRLVAINGTLFFPYGGLDDNFQPQPTEPSLLMRRYDAGDVDTVPWPMHSEYVSAKELRGRLARALYDEREMNSAFGDRDLIELPDGTPFDMDEELAKAQPEKKFEW